MGLSFLDLEDWMRDCIVNAASIRPVRQAEALSFRQRQYEVGAVFLLAQVAQLVTAEQVLGARLEASLGFQVYNRILMDVSGCV